MGFAARTEDGVNLDLQHVYSVGVAEILTSSCMGSAVVCLRGKHALKLD
jgi:hypothetical protein